MFEEKSSANLQIFNLASCATISAAERVHVLHVAILVSVNDQFDTTQTHVKASVEELPRSDRPIGISVGHSLNC